MTRGFATLGPLWLQPPFTEDYSPSFHSFFSLFRTGQTSDPIHHLSILQSPVFLINSRLCLVSATTLSSISIDFTRVAPLLPRLRGQLAEFLNESYPAHLSLFSQPTCVGLGYGHKKTSLAAFLGSRASMASTPLQSLPVRSRLSQADFPAQHAYSLDPGLPSPGST